MGVLNMAGRLSLDASPFHSTLKGVTGTIGGFANSLKGMLAGALGAGALLSYTKRMIDLGAQIHDTSTKLGISAETFQELSFAAKQSGAEIGNVETAFRALAMARIEALQTPGGDQAAVFGAFGIGAKELKEMRLEDTFRRIADTIKTTDFGASEMAMVNKLLGRTGSELIPMFRDGLREAADEARALGLVMDNSVTKQLKDMNDNLDRLGTKSAEVFTRMTADIIAAANQLIEANLKQARKGKFSIMDLFSGAKQGQFAAEMIGEQFGKALGAPIQNMFNSVGKAVFGGAPGERVKKDFQLPEKELKEEKIKQERGLAPLTDSLRSVGNFLGGDPNSGVVRQLSEQTKELKEIRRNTSRQATEGSRFPL